MEKQNIKMYTYLQVTSGRDAYRLQDEVGWTRYLHLIQVSEGSAEREMDNKMYKFEQSTRKEEQMNKLTTRKFSCTVQFKH